MALLNYVANRGRHWIGVIGVFALCTVALLWISPSTASAGTPVFVCDNDRLGFGITTDATRYDLTPLKAGWYVNWGLAQATPHPAGLDFAQIISTRDTGYWPNGDNLKAEVLRNRGSLWLIGNEPDCMYQDNVLPENYTRIYHEVYYLIKGLDPMAQIAIGGVVQATPARMEWIDAVWDTYQRLYGEAMPVDVWNMHAFVLREVRQGYGAACGQGSDTGEWGAGMPPGTLMNCGWWLGADDHARLDLVQDQVIRFRTWMRDHGQQNKPLVVSEYGILFPEELGYTYTVVRDFMVESFNYFLTARDTALGYPADDYHLVQQWAWYSLDDINFESAGNTLSALINPKTYQITSLGQEFAAYAASKAQSCPAYVDLQPLRLKVTTPAPVRYGEPGAIQVELEVRNQGNTAAPASTVRLWDGDPNAGGTLAGTGTLPTVPARYQGTAIVLLNGTVPAFGVRTLTVQIDADNQVTESLEGNNRATITVDFGSVNLSVGSSGWQLVRGPLHPKESAQVKLASTPVMVTQSAPAGANIRITPPAFRATWYDGNPLAGGQVIATQQLSAPAAFGPAGVVPEQAWSPLVLEPRTAWLEVSLLNGAPDAAPGDNLVAVTLPATSDFILTQATATSPVAGENGLADVSLRFQAANRGVRPPAAPLEVALFAGASSAGPEVGRAYLVASSDWTEILVWPGQSAGFHSYVARVDPGNAESETDEANNELTGTALVFKMRDYLPLLLR